jgi:hypothetical protein
MAFIKAPRKQRLLLAGPLAVAATVLTVTACGGGGGSTAAAQGAAGQWTKAEVSQFTAASGAGGNGQDACAVGYFERDMSFGNAMAVTAVDPASGPSLSAAQVKAALDSKYGTTQGDAVNTEFEQVVTDSNSNCDGATASPTAAAAAPAPTSESSCTVDCVNPIATGESEWLAQVQAPLQNVQEDLNSISSDASGDPASLSLDGAQLTQDAQAALNEETDPAPVDNSDFVAAMNDYVAAGNDYSGDNSSGQQNTAQASQEIAEGNSAVNSFNAANAGSGSTAAAPASPEPASSAPVAAATTPEAAATAAALWCGSVVNVRTAPSLAVWETGSGGADNAYVNVLPGFKVVAADIDNPSTPAATVVAESASLCSEVLEADEEPPPADLAQYNTAMSDFLEASQVLHTGTSTFAASLATARTEVNAGTSELNAFLAAIGK